MAVAKMCIFSSQSVIVRSQVSTVMQQETEGETSGSSQTGVSTVEKRTFGLCFSGIKSLPRHQNDLTIRQDCPIYTPGHKFWIKYFLPTLTKWLWEWDLSLIDKGHSFSKCNVWPGQWGFLMCINRTKKREYISENKFIASLWATVYICFLVTKVLQDGCQLLLHISLIFLQWYIALQTCFKPFSLLYTLCHFFCQKLFPVLSTKWVHHYVRLQIVEDFMTPAVEPRMNNSVCEFNDLTECINICSYNSSLEWLQLPQVWKTSALGTGNCGTGNCGANICVFMCVRDLMCNAHLRTLILSVRFQQIQIIF